jgi:hypothetical protein
MWKYLYCNTGKETEEAESLGKSGIDGSTIVT